MARAGQQDPTATATMVRSNDTKVGFTKIGDKIIGSKERAKLLALEAHPLSEKATISEDL